MTPKDPPATKIALGESFPSEERRVTSAPETWRQALPRQRIIMLTKIDEISKQKSSTPKKSSDTPIIPSGIFGKRSEREPISDCGTNAKASKINGTIQDKRLL